MFKFPPTFCQWSNWGVWPIYKHYYITTNGKSLIDYALVSVDLFSVKSIFKVHDMFSFSSHLPISVNLCFTCPNVEDTEEEIVIDKIVWDENKTEQLTNSIQTNITVLPPKNNLQVYFQKYFLC